MVFDTFCYAEDELATKSYASYFIQFELVEYLKTNYPKIHYTVNNTNNYISTGDDGDCDE